MSTLKAQHIREVFAYSRSFRKHTFVFYVDDVVIEDRLLNRLVKDMLYLLDVGIRILIVTGARSAINDVLHKYNKESKFINDKRIISTEDMELVQMASFNTAVGVLNEFSKYKQATVIGNWIKARGIGVVNGVDYLHAGTVKTVDTQAIRVLVEDNIIPIFPAVGWSDAGKPYSLEAKELATKLAIYMRADKLFFVTGDYPEEILKNIHIENNPHIDRGDDKTILRIKREAIESILETNKNESNSSAYHMLDYSLSALKNNIDRIHWINGRVDGSLLEELFSPLGSGLMIHNDEYQAIESLKREEIQEAWNIMEPMIRDGVLASRDISSLEESYEDYVCYKVDGEIYGLAALHKLDDNSAEIAGVVVKSHFDKAGVGRKIISYLIERGKQEKYKQLFVLTTHTGDWFETLGFIQSDIEEVPESRRQKYQLQKRGSRVYRYTL